MTPENFQTLITDTFKSCISSIKERENKCATSTEPLHEISAKNDIDLFYLLESSNKKAKRKLIDKKIEDGINYLLLTKRNLYDNLEA